ncbi:MAG: transporter substrate-binding domain-containing protein, partial [Arcobacteraceae bacterium]|nr:transporter substrate-binding domain-containing protein [Arcobacteraceae bacterium]
QNKSFQALDYEAKVLKELASMGGVPLGNIDERKLKRIQDIYGLMGLMKKDINFKDFIFDGKKIYLTKEEKEFLKNTTFKINVSKEWRPFSFEDDDKKPAGIASEYWKILADELGLQVEYQFEETFTEQLDAIQSKSADVLFSVGKTKDREKYAIFSEKYLSFPISIATSKEEEFIEDFSKILDKKIAVGKNFTAHKLLQEKYPHTHFILVKNVQVGLELLAKGEVYAMVELKPILSYQIKKNGYKNIKISGNTGINFDLAIMMRDDYPLLQSVLNKAIATVDEEKVNAILKRYENIEFEKREDYTIFYNISIGIGFLLLLLAFRQYILEKVNKNLKLVVDEKTKKLQELNETLERRVQEAIKENKSKDIILFQQSKMASMGEMIGNIAHQWRQPLSVISTSATGISFKIDYGMDVSKDELLGTLEKVNETVQFLSRTIDDFQDYLKPQTNEEEFNIKDVITKNLEMFGRTFSNNDIEMILDFDEIMIQKILKMSCYK